MHYKGINYDVGTKTLTGGLTREGFDSFLVTKEIETIKNELHCNAIRISGLDIDRLVRTSEIALKQGLTVWFSPALHYSDQVTTLKYIIQCAMAAEKLRLVYPNIIFVTGCELSLFTSGFINGQTGNDRIKKMFSPLSLLKNMLGIKRVYNKRLNFFLEAAVHEIRKHFRGQLTYAAGAWEKIDWHLFDIIGVDLYRSVYNKRTYVKELQAYKKMGKPISIMEFGCCAYKGADEKGPMGWAIVDWKKNRPELKGKFIRDGHTQAQYIIDLLTIFDKEKVFASFVFTFVSYNYIYDENPQYDLDMASYGIVKVIRRDVQGYEGLPWMPKIAFFELSKYYATH